MLVIKNLPANAEELRDAGSVPGLGRYPREGNGNPLHILVWRIPWTEEPGGLWSMGSQRVGHNWATEHTRMNTYYLLRQDAFYNQLCLALDISSQKYTTGYFYMCRYNCWCCLVAKSCLTLLLPSELQPDRILFPGDFPGKNTGVSCHFLLQGIFLTQESNPSLLHWQTGSLPLSYQGSQYI